MKIIERLINYLQYKLNRMRCTYFNIIYGIGFGKHCLVEKGVIIKSVYGGKITIGDNCQISAGAQILTHGGDITIGSNCTVNPLSIVYGQGGVNIGNNVRIAAHCVIVPSNHIFADITVPIYLQGLSKKGITIEDDVWLGAGVKVLDGVTIGKGCVVGANSVVTKSLEPYGVYVGIPAKLLKYRK